MTKNTKTNKPKILILGSGLAGLGASIALKKDGYNSLLLEKESKPGGLFTNNSLNGCDFDYGPKILLLNDPESKKVILPFLEDKYEQYPVQESVYLNEYGLVDFPLQRNLIDLPVEERINVLKSLFEAQAKETSVSNFKDWLISNYGEYFSELILIPYEEKKWQMDLEEMDYRWALKRPVKVKLDEVIKGSISKLEPDKYYYYPKNGNISSFTKALVDEAGDILLEHKVESIDIERKIVIAGGKEFKFDAVVSTLPLDYAVDITKSLPSNLKNEKSKFLKRLSINIFNLVFEGNYDLKGTAIYFPEREFIFRRITILENLCPALKREGKTPITIEVSVDPNKKLNQKDLFKTVMKDMMKIDQFKQMGEPIDHEMIHVDFAYPLQKRGLSYYVADLRRFYSRHNIYHCGRGGSFDYCNGDEAFLQGKEAAEKIIQRLEHKQGVQKSLSFTVGIPSYKSGHSIIKTVESLRESEGVGEFEIIIVVDGDLNEKIEKQLIKYDVKIIKNKRRKGQTAANSQIMKLAKTDVLILTQDDVLFDKNSLKNIIKEFENDLDLTMVAPNLVPLDAENRFEKAINSGVRIVRKISSRLNYGDNYLSSIGRCLAYKTEILKDFFVDDKIINCDAYYYFENKRLGGKFKFTKDAVVHYRSPQNLDEHLKQVRKFVISEKEMSKYLEMDMNDEYKLPPILMINSLLRELIKSPINTTLYILISIYARTRPRSFYSEATRFWEVDKSTKKINKP